MPLLIGSALCPAPTEGHSTGVTAIVKSQLVTHPMGGSDKKPTAEERDTREAKNFEADGWRVWRGGGGACRDGF